MDMGSTRKVSADFFDQRWADELAAAGESHYLLLFLFLIVTCRNPVGIVEVNPRLWNFKLNPPTPFKGEDIFTKYGKRIRKIEGHPDKGIIVGFCDFQRNFSQNARQWAWIEKDLEAVGLTYDDLKHFDEEAQQTELDLGLPPPALKASGRGQVGEKPRRNIIPPERDWVIDYFASLQVGTNQANQFFDYWTSAGWKRRNGLMADWEASARTWIAKWRGEQPRLSGGGTKTPVRQVTNVRKKF